jgi:hypothetical protein
VHRLAARGFLKQYIGLLADVGRIKRLRLGVGEGQQTVAPELLILVAHLILNGQSRCARALGVGENMELRHRKRIEKLIAVLEIFGAFAAATHHDINADEGVGHLLLDEIDFVGKDVAGVAPVHQTQHLVVAALQGNVEMGHEGAAVGAVVDEGVVDEVGLERTDAEALDALHLVERLDQVDEFLTRRAAEVADVDARQYDFLTAFGRSLPGLLHQRRYRRIARKAPGIRNGAVGAEVERLAKLEEFKVLRKPRICVSTRRLEEEGLYSLLKTYGKSTFNDFRGKRTSAEELNYGFGHDPITPLEKNDLDKIAEKSKHNFKKGRFHHKHSLNRHDKSSKNLINKEKSQSLSRIRHDTQNKKLKQEIVKKEEMPPSTKRKRIFYSVCGEGMGHAIRSGVIIEELIKHHEVYIFSSNRAYEYLNGKFDNVFEIGGFNTVYENNKVRNKKTFFNAVKTNPTNLKEGYDVLYKQSQKVKPNLIISDFENYASMLSKLINVPLISLDNIHMITQTAI